MKEDAPDAHEERTMWNTIVNDLRKLKNIQTKAAEIGAKQVELEAKIAKCEFIHIPFHLFLSFFLSPLVLDEMIFPRLNRPHS